MAYSQSPQAATERRCINCGTRVARDAESCFMCGQDLRIKPKAPKRISWIDTLLVFAVIGILGFWWQVGAQPEQAQIEEPAEPILPGSIPVLGPTSTPTETPIPTATPTAIPPQEVTLSHPVSAGETLLAIAGNYRVTVDEILRANNKTDEFIRVGETLKIPIEQKAADVNSVASTFPYQVKQGDTIASIALRTNSTITDILTANNLSANAIIRPGQVLTIPSQIPPDVLESAADEVVESGTTDEVTESGTTVEEDTAQTLDRIYIQPGLLAPPNEAIFSRDESILLRWASVSILDSNEWYVVQLNSANSSTATILPQWKKTNTLRLGNELAPPEGESVTYSWFISVIRVNNGPDGSRAFTPTSPPSEIRTFTWQ